MTPTSSYRNIPGIDGHFIDADLRVVRADGKVMPQWQDQAGYPRVNLSLGLGVRRVIRVHELVCLAFNGPRPDGMQVRHLDGSKDNYRPENLCWGTPRENAQDRYRHGTVLLGCDHPLSKLNATKVRKIRALIISGVGNTAIGRRFKVSRTTIRNIRLNKIWRQIDAA